VGCTDTDIEWLCFVETHVLKEISKTRIDSGNLLFS
jgi:hypothetical protein